MTSIVRRLILLLLLSAVLYPSDMSARGRREAFTPARSVVKIHSTLAGYDQYRPWNNLGPSASGGSGSVIAGRKVLTNAHCVHDASFVQVSLPGEATKYIAEVAFVSHDADLALLSVEDESFWAKVKPLSIGNLPHQQDEVEVYGFPMGGNTLSVTSGVVSRIEHTRITHSSRLLLTGQLDAPINPGNSGGPVVAQGEIVGVVMQSHRSADGIGYMVPSPVVRHFLADIEDGRYDGFPALGVSWQNLESPSLKAYSGLAGDVDGVRVTRVHPGSPAAGLLDTGDVLVAIDGQAIAVDGTVELREGERTHFAWLLQGHQLGDTTTLSWLRGAKSMSGEVELNTSMGAFDKVSMETYDRPPTYYIYGGLVFQPLSKSFLRGWGGRWLKAAPRELVVIMTEHNVQAAEGEEVVVMTRVLAAEANQGYQSTQYSIIRSVGGVPILNMKELIAAVEAAADEPYVVFEDNKGRIIALDRAEADAAGPQILKRYRIPADRSEDLR